MINLTDIKRKGSPNIVAVQTRIDAETKQWLDQFCSKENITVSSLICELIKQFKRGQHGP